MVRDAWADTDDEVYTGTYVSSNKADPIPEGVKCISTIEGVEWSSKPGSTHENPNFKWRVESPSEYEGKVWFYTVKFNGDDPSSQYYKEEKQDKIIKTAEKLFWNIDANAGGFIAGIRAKERRKPSSEELQKYLIGATMICQMGEFNGSQILRGVDKNPDSATPKPKPVAKKATVFDDSGDIPF